MGGPSTLIRFEVRSRLGGGGGGGAPLLLGGRVDSVGNPDVESSEVLRLVFALLPEFEGCLLGGGGGTSFGSEPGSFASRSAAG